MYLTKECDYAIRIMKFIKDSEKIVDAKKISDATNVPPRFALKILRRLVSAKMLKSYKGAKGGYVLEGKSEDITLYDVVSIIGGEYRLSKCLGEENDCCLSGSCSFRNIFAEISADVQKKLVSIKLSEI